MQASQGAPPWRVRRSTLRWAMAAGAVAVVVLLVVSGAGVFRFEEREAARLAPRPVSCTSANFAEASALRRAYATYLEAGDEEWVPVVARNARLLRAMDAAPHDFVVMHAEERPPSAEAASALRTAGATLHAVRDLCVKDEACSRRLNRMHALELRPERYHRVIFLHRTVAVRRTLEYVFEIEHPMAVRDVPLITWQLAYAAAGSIVPPGMWYLVMLTQPAQGALARFKLDRVSGAKERADEHLAARNMMRLWGNLPLDFCAMVDALEHQANAVTVGLRSPGDLEAVRRHDDARERATRLLPLGAPPVFLDDRPAVSGSRSPDEGRAAAAAAAFREAEREGAPAPPPPSAAELERRDAVLNTYCYDVPQRLPVPLSRLPPPPPRDTPDPDDAWGMPRSEFERVAREETARRAKEEAYVAFLSSDSDPWYVEAVRMMADDLRRLCPPWERREFVVMVPAASNPAVSRETRKALRRDKITMHEVPDVNVMYSNSGRLAGVWPKLRVWGLDRFRHVVYIDPDQMVRRCPSSLFSYPATTLYGLVPNRCGSGMIALRPSAEVAGALVERAERSCEPNDQMFVCRQFMNSAFYSAWWTDGYRLLYYDRPVGHGYPDGEAPELKPVQQYTVDHAMFWHYTGLKLWEKGACEKRHKLLPEREFFRAYGRFKKRRREKITLPMPQCFCRPADGCRQRKDPRKAVSHAKDTAAFATDGASSAAVRFACDARRNCYAQSASGTSVGLGKRECSVGAAGAFQAEWAALWKEAGDRAFREAGGALDRSANTPGSAGLRARAAWSSQIDRARALGDEAVPAAQQDRPAGAHELTCSVVATPACLDGRRPRPGTVRQIELADVVVRAGSRGATAENRDVTGRRGTIRVVGTAGPGTPLGRDELLLVYPVHDNGTIEATVVARLARDLAERDESTTSAGAPRLHVVDEGVVCAAWRSTGDEARPSSLNMVALMAAMSVCDGDVVAYGFDAACLAEGELESVKAIAASGLVTLLGVS